MKEKPILFSAPMVRAILEGRKTQTRRVIKPQPERIAPDSKNRLPLAFWADGTKWIKPPYQPGDVLWVRETWGNWSYDNPECNAVYFQYRADYPDGAKAYMYDETHECDLPKWRPSIFMPRAAARLFLEVKNVRVERLQDISHDDAVAEGTLQWICEEHKSGSYLDNAMRGAACAKPERAFTLLWDSINGKKHPWESNPWVWVIDFRRAQHGTTAP